MRKRIRFKVIPLFICWFIILAHNITPHNHHEAGEFVKYGHSHSTGFSDETSDIFPKLHGLCDKEDECNFSGLLFHNLNQDHLNVNYTDNKFWNPVIGSSRLIIPGIALLYRNNFFGSASLRSPPRA